MKRISIGVIVGCIALSAIFYAAYINLAEDNHPIYFKPENWGETFVVLLNQPLHYLSQDVEVNIQPPTLSNSEETQLEIDYLHSLARNRTLEERTAIFQEYDSFLNNFLVTLNISNSSHPLTIQLIEKVHAEVTYFILREKWKYQRARPYEVDSTITTVIPPPPHASYPSGHAGQSMLIALILGELAPTRKDELIAVADSIGNNREIAGVHFPSDTRAGQELARQVATHLLNDAEFKEEMEQVVFAEWQ